MSQHLLFFVCTTARCKINGHSYPGIPIFFDERGLIQYASDFMVHLVYGQRIPRTTARTYAMHLQKFFKYLKTIGVPWDEVSDDVLRRWRDTVTDAGGLASDAEVASLITVFRFYLWAEETGRLQYAVAIHGHDGDRGAGSPQRQYRISAAPSARRGHFHWPHLPKVRPSAVRHIPTDSEIERLHVSLSDTQTGQRDSLLLLLYEEGCLRRFEALGLTVDDIASWDVIEDALDEGTVFHLSIRGKGGLARSAEVTPELMKLAREYIEGDRAEAVRLARRRNPRYKEPKALFLTQTTASPIDMDHVSRRISDLMRSVGIENASGHRLRATGLTALAKAYDGVDESGTPLPARQVLIKVAARAGHRHIESLEPYLDLARSSARASSTEDEIRHDATVRSYRRQIARLEAQLSAINRRPPPVKTRKRGSRRRP